MIRSADEFIRLRTSPDPAEYLRAANDDAPNEVWLELIAHHPEMRTWVAQNKTVSIDALLILAYDPNPEIRCVVAMKNKLPPNLMLQLANDDDVTVRERIAYNKNPPFDVLQLLSSDTCMSVAEAAKRRLAVRT